MPEAPGRVEFVHRSWPADPAQLSVIRRELSGWLAPLALTDDEVADVVLAVDEAAANAVRHAYGPATSGVVELTLWTEPGTLCVEVVDHGSWRPPSVPAPVGDAGDGGRGISLMSTMADAVLINYDARGSRVLLRHRVEGAEPVDGAAESPTDDRTDDRTDDDPNVPLTPLSRGLTRPAGQAARGAQPVPVVPGAPIPSGSRSRGSGVGAHRPPLSA